MTNARERGCQGARHGALRATVCLSPEGRVCWQAGRPFRCHLSSSPARGFSWNVQQPLLPKCWLVSQPHESMHLDSVVAMETTGVQPLCFSASQRFRCSYSKHGNSVPQSCSRRSPFSPPKLEENKSGGFEWTSGIGSLSGSQCLHLQKERTGQALKFRLKKKK